MAPRPYASGWIAPAADHRDATADRSEGGDEALVRQDETAPSAGTAVANATAGLPDDAIAAGIGRSGRLEDDRRAPGKILQHRSYRAACPAFTKQLALDPPAKRASLWPGRPAQTVAEEIVSRSCPARCRSPSRCASALSHTAIAGRPRSRPTARPLSSPSSTGALSGNQRVGSTVRSRANMSC